MNQRLTDAQIIEFFHLAFLQVLQARLNQTRYVVKGGANLRYFFESLRYSRGYRSRRRRNRALEA